MIKSINVENVMKAKKMSLTIKNKAYAIMIAGMALSAALSTPALADCAAPASPEGGLAYFTIDDTYRLCDGADTWVTLSSGGGASGVFDVVSNVVQPTSASVAYATDDFVFGSYQLGDTGDVNHDNRFWFDKSRGAFRTGSVIGSEWDDGNVGDYSFSSGLGNIASNAGSFAFGGSTVASGAASTTWGLTSAASGIATTAWGSATQATNTYATAWGDQSIASGPSSTAWGVLNVASGEGSTAFGGFSTASGISSLASGSLLTASGISSIAMGNQVVVGSGTPLDGKGDRAFGVGLGATAGTIPKVTGQRSFAIFMGDQGGYDFTENQKFAIIGGEFQIDDAGASVNKGCIRYNSATTKIEFSHDCSSYAEFGASTSAAGINREIQFNDSGVFGTDTAFTYTSGERLTLSSTNNLFIQGGVENTAAQYNLALGPNALDSLPTTCVGPTDCDFNTGVGYNALTTNSSGYYNTAIGANALAGNTTGIGNTAIGLNSQILTNVGFANASFGAASLGFNTGGTNNLAIGTQSLYQNTLANNNVGIGTNALLNNQTGNNNVAIGANAGVGAGTPSTVAINNVIIGANAGYGITNSSNNILIGFQTGDNLTSGDNNIIIGYDLNASAAGAAEELNIGNILFGDIGTTSTDPKIGAYKYCDETLSTCFVATDVGASSGVFDVVSNVVLPASASVTYATDDFVFGSPSLDGDGNSDHFSRMFFDKSKSAFRAGAVNAAQWDDGSIGIYSAAIGLNQTATNLVSIAIGASSAVTADYSVSIGSSNNISGVGSYAIASGSTITSDFSAVIGNFSTAAAANSIILGNEVKTATGTYNMAISLSDQSDTDGLRPQVTGSGALGIFMDQSDSYTLSTDDTMALIGGQLMIDNDGSTAATKGCIDYSGSALRYSNDCTTYTAFAESPWMVNVAGNLVHSNTNVDITLADFVFGSKTLDSNGTAPHSSRMFFDKSKGAFRAGTVISTQWNAANIGTGSAAFNSTTIASGSNSFATGLGTTASGGISTAMGLDTVSNGDQSVAMGDGTTASEENAVTMGDGTAASGVNSLATGETTVASNRNAVAMGLDTTASGIQSVAMGGTTAASGDNSLAMGTKTDASGDQSVAMGSTTIASGDNSLAMGDSAVASGLQSVAMGTQTAASGDNSFATGSKSISSGTSSMAIGTSTRATGADSFSVGRHAHAGEPTPTDGFGASSVVFGLQTKRHAIPPKISGNRSMALFMDTDVQDINSGLDVTSSDVFVIYGGTMGIGTLTPTADFHIANPGDATIKISADTDNVTEDDNPSIRFEQDGGATISTIGMSGGSGGAFNKAINFIDSNSLVIDRNGSGAIQFSTSNNRRMSIEPTGEVSVGMKTLTNDAQFEVRGDAIGANVDDSSIIAQFISVTPNTDKLRVSRRRVVAGGDWTNTEMRIQRLVGTTAMGYVAFGQHSGTDNPMISWGENITERMRLDSNGQLGIGITAPNVALDVSGDIEYTGIITDVSDRRLKKDIKSLIKRGPMLTKIDNINTYSFTMKDDEKGQIEFGVIAQELEEIFPELVKTAEDEMGTKSVNYVGLIAPIIEATKELKSQNEALKSDLDNLQKQVDLLNKAAVNNADKAGFDLWTLLMLAAIFGGSSLMFLMGSAIKPRRS